MALTSSLDVVASLHHITQQRHIGDDGATCLNTPTTSTPKT